MEIGLGLYILLGMQALPLLLVYIGEKLQQRSNNKQAQQLITILEQALARAQGSAPPSVALPEPPVVSPPAPPAKPPAPPPVPSAPAVPGFSGFPAWFMFALQEVGNRETGNNSGAAVQRYINLAKTGQIGDPWCAIFANAMLAMAGVPGSGSPSSQSFRTNPNFIKLDGPQPGCLVIYWRGTQGSGMGHVGFYRGEDDSHVWTLGGNENDMVQIEALPKSSPTFGLIGYWWPKVVPVPTTGPIKMPAGSPVSIKALPSATKSDPNGAQKNIIATYFTGAQTAYGGPVPDDTPGVALPYRFSPGARPRVRVTNSKSGASVDCDIVDVGPWNIDDPYWQTGSRPQAESGTDRRGRHTNGAGIDLTIAAATAVGIDGKGLVDWQFLAPLTS